MKFALSLPVLFLSLVVGRAQAEAAATAATEDGDERQLANKCLKHSGRPKPDYTPCNLGRCYVNEYCYGGVCYGDEKCTYDLQCQEPRACQPSSGTCYNPPPGRALLEDSPDRELNDQPPINKPDYTPCDDGDPDTYDDYCLGGTCVGYEPVCTGEWACEGELPVCGGSDLCVCSSTAEGEKFCWDGDVTCDIPTCATSADCPSGASCIPNTCCEVPVCLYPCPTGGRTLQDNGEGECVPTPISLCDR